MYEDVFYLVWDRNQIAEPRKHRSREDAEREAERLARDHSDGVFYVLRSVSMTKQQDSKTLVREKHVCQPPFSDEQPF